MAEGRGGAGMGPKLLIPDAYSSRALPAPTAAAIPLQRSGPDRSAEPSTCVEQQAGGAPHQPCPARAGDHRDPDSELPSPPLRALWPERELLQLIERQALFPHDFNWEGEAGPANGAGGNG